MQNEDGKKLVLICERVDYGVNLKKENDNYVLEGIFAEFGKKNNNNRIYTEENYLPFVEYLKPKIKQKKLLGELDHPVGENTTQIRLEKASHIIEDLYYDKDNRVLRGRIRILDTPAGKIAKSLLDSGVPLSISSRAIGEVDENTKTAKIIHLITYDLVSQPGFESATLSRVNESLNESLGIPIDSNIQIYNLSNEEAKKFIKKSENTTINKDDKKNKIMIENYQNLETTLNEIKNSIENLKDEKIRERVDSLELAVKSILNKVNEVVDSQNELIEKFETETNKNFEKEMDEVADVLEGLLNKINKVEEELKSVSPVTEKDLDEVADVLEALNNKIDNAINLNKSVLKESESVVDESDLNDVADILEKLTKRVLNLEKQISRNYIKEEEEYSNTVYAKEKEVKDTIEDILDIIEKLVDDVNSIKSNLPEFKTTWKMGSLHSDKEIIKTNIQESIQELKRENKELREDVKNLIEFNEMLLKAFQSAIGDKITKDEIGVIGDDECCEEEVKENYDKLKKEQDKFEDKYEDEETEVEKELEKVDEVQNKIEKLLNAVQLQENENQTLLNKYPFLNLLEEGERKYFKSLDETQKRRVEEEVKTKGIFTKEGLKKTIEKVINESIDNENLPNFLKLASEEHLNFWNTQLNESEKAEVRKLAKLYEGKLNTEYQVRNFWNSQIISRFKKNNVEEVKNTPKTILNESVRVSDDYSLGYSKSLIENIAKTLKDLNK